MMCKKIFWFSSVLLAFTFLSCKNSSEPDDNSVKEVTAYITGVELKALDKEQVGNIIKYFHSDTLSGQINLEVKTLYRLEGGTLEDFYRSTGSGDDKIPRVTNPLVWGKCSFKFNKDIESDGISVLANDDILTFTNLKGRYFFPYALSPFAIHNITMDKAHFQIKKGSYKIYASWKNVEGKTFEDEIEVYIDIGY